MTDTITTTATTTITGSVCDNDVALTSDEPGTVTRPVNCDEWLRMEYVGYYVVGGFWNDDGHESWVE